MFVGPNTFDPILIFGFMAAILGGLDSPLGAVVGGLVLGLALSYVSGLRGIVDWSRSPRSVILVAGSDGAARGLFSVAQERRV